MKFQENAESAPSVAPRPLAVCGWRSSSVVRPSPTRSSNEAGSRTSSCASAGLREAVLPSIASEAAAPSVAAEPGFERSRHHYSIPNPLRDQSTFGRVSRRWNRPPPLVVVEDWSPVRRSAGHMQMDLASVATAASASQRAAACPDQRGAAARSSRPSAGSTRAPTCVEINQ